MSNLTENETWIDKLIDELVDTKNDVADYRVINKQCGILLELIFNNARLDYSGENMRIENEDAIFEYLRVIAPDAYYKKLNSLKTKRDAEIEKLKELKASEIASVTEAKEG